MCLLSAFKVTIIVEAQSGTWCLPAHPPLASVRGGLRSVMFAVLHYESSSCLTAITWLLFNERKRGLAWHDPDLSECSTPSSELIS